MEFEDETDFDLQNDLASIASNESIEYLSEMSSDSELSE